MTASPQPHRPNPILRALRAFAALGLIGFTAGLVVWTVSPTAATFAPDAVTWAPASTAAIHPGVETFTQGSQCTSNFVFSDGTNVFIGQAAHCAGTGGNTATDGCTSPTLPVGTPVTISGAGHPGTLV